MTLWFLELSKAIDFVAAIGTVLLGVVVEVCNYINTSQIL